MLIAKKERCAEKRIIEDFSCERGCLNNEKCYNIGSRIENEFCSEDLVFVNQFEEDFKCLNNFECGSNVCVGEKCISLSLFQRFLNWLGL